MSLHPLPVAPVPEETARVARAAFRRGNPYLTLRDEFGTLFSDEQFTALFPTRGQPAEAPWRLALVTLLQFAEDLSDRQAAEAVRSRIDWKYLLGLELTDAGFDFSVLCEFRARLLAGSAQWLLFETLLTAFRERKLLKERGIQRTDATHVLGAVRVLNRLETVGETLRHTLNALAMVAPDWLRSQSPPEWLTRYGLPFSEWRLPKGDAQRERLALTIGEDGFFLLEALAAPSAPAGLAMLPVVQMLRTVWLQQYYRESHPQPSLRLRTPEELPPAPQRLQSPYDPEARYARKRQTGWLGYKGHLTETCDPDAPHLITHVETTSATTPDVTVLPDIHAALSQRDLLPAEHVVDAGYVEAEGLVRSQKEHQVDLIGPALESTSWQAKAAGGYALADFVVDWDARVVRCPNGKQSVGWVEKEQRGEPVIQVSFARADCRNCPQRESCTRSSQSRRLTLRSQPEYEALQAARGRQASQGFAARYAVRAGVEGTISQAVRTCGMRRARYLGLSKVHLQHLLTAAALNLVRTAAWLMEPPRARTRTSAFARLAAVT
jgi:transposase